MKKLLALLLAVVMVLGMIPVMASADTEAATPSIAAVSLTLDGILGVNLKVSSNGADMSGYSISFTIGSDTESQVLTDSTINGSYYVYTAKLPAHRLHETVKVQLCSGETVVQSINWTVANYLNSLKNGVTATDELKALCEALDNYGTYAAAYAAGESVSIEAVEAVTASDLEAYKHSVSVKNGTGLKPVTSLFIDDACDLRIKFNAEAFGDNILYIDGKIVETTVEDDLVVYTISELVPQDWSHMYDIKVVSGEEVVFQCAYSVLSYAYINLSKEAELATGLNGLLKAMSLYGTAAVAYIELPDRFIADITATSAADELLAISEDRKAGVITYEYDVYEGDDPYGLCIDTTFAASANGSYARTWEMSGTITKDDIDEMLYLSFGVKSADGKEQWFGLCENSVSLQNNGYPQETMQPHDGTIIQYNQATTSFYWKESSHNADRLDYKLVLENDVLTAYFGNATCECGACSMRQAWQIPLTDATYGGFNANSSYRLAIYAVHPCSLTISDITVKAEGIGIALSDLAVRDPFVLEDDGTYYLYVTGYNGFFQTWSTTDFVLFQDCGTIFSAEPGDTFRPIDSSSFWAPEVYKYTNPDTNETAYYMLATLEREDCVRATAILKADSPTGPFAEFSSYDHGFITPSGHSCLDGTLYIENGVPYMIYAHEFSCSACDDDMGDMEYVQLSNDLSHAVTDPVELFSAEDLTNYSWFESLLGNDDSNITDGPFVYSKNGTNYLLWSTFIDSTYIQAYTTFGAIADGIDAKNNSVQLYTDDGGHGMIFDFDGQDTLILHTPNDDPRPALFNVTLNGTQLSIDDLGNVEYQITYEGVEATEHSNPTTYTRNTAESIILTDPAAREGYIFAGWYIGQTQITSLLDQSGDITITAMWETDILYGSGFAYSVTVGDTTQTSAVDIWNVSDAQNGTVTVSYEDGGKFQPLYFSETAVNFAVEAVFEYDMTQAHDQYDLCGGFTFHDGSASGYALGNWDGFITTDWSNGPLKGLVSDAFMKTDTTRSVKLAIAKQDDLLVFYIDDEKVAMASWTEVIKTSATGTNAIGLIMNADAASTLKVTEYNLYTGTDAATQYIYDRGPWTVFGDINGTGWGTDFTMTKQADGTWLSDEAFTFASGAQLKCRNGSIEIGDGLGVNYVIATAGTYYIKLDPTAASITLVVPKYITQNLDGGYVENEDGSVSFAAAKEDKDDIKYLLTTEAGTYIEAEATIKYRDWFHEGGFALSDGTNIMYFAITTDNGNMIVGYNNSEYATNYVILNSGLNVKDDMGWQTDNYSNAPIKAKIVYDDGIVNLYIDQGSGWMRWNKNALNVGTLAGFDNTNGGTLDTTQPMSVGIAYRAPASGCGYVENFTYTTDTPAYKALYNTQDLDGITENADGSVVFGAAKEDKSDIKYLLTKETGTYITAEATFRYRDWEHAGGFALNDGTNTMYFAISVYNGNMIVGYNNAEYGTNYVILQSNLEVTNNLGWAADKTDSTPIKAKIVYDNGMVTLYLNQGNGWERWTKHALNVATLAGFDNSNGGTLDTTKPMSIGVAYRASAAGVGYVENFSYTTNTPAYKSLYNPQNLDGITENADGTVTFGAAKEDLTDIKYLLTNETSTYITAEATFRYRDYEYAGGFALNDGTNTMYFGLSVYNGNMIVGYNNAEYGTNYVILQDHLQVTGNLGWAADYVGSQDIRAKIVYDNGLVFLYVYQDGSWVQWNKNALNVATLSGFDNGNGGTLDTTQPMSVGIAFNKNANGCGYVQNFSYSLERFDSWTVFGDINGTCWGTHFAMTKQADGTWLSAAFDLEANANLKCVNNGNEAYYVGAADGSNYVVAQAGTYYISLDPTAKTITLIPA